MVLVEKLPNPTATHRSNPAPYNSNPINGELLHLGSFDVGFHRLPSRISRHFVLHVLTVFQTNLNLKHIMCSKIAKSANANDDDGGGDYEEECEKSHVVWPPSSNGDLSNK